MNLELEYFKKLFDPNPILSSLYRKACTPISFARIFLLLGDTRQVCLLYLSLWSLFGCVLSLLPSRNRNLTAGHQGVMSGSWLFLRDIWGIYYQGFIFLWILVTPRESMQICLFLLFYTYSGQHPADFIKIFKLWCQDPAKFAVHRFNMVAAPPLF